MVKPRAGAWLEYTMPERCANHLFPASQVGLGPNASVTRENDSPPDTGLHYAPVSPVYDILGPLISANCGADTTPR